MDDLAGLNFSTNPQAESTSTKNVLRQTTYAAPIPSRGIAPNYSLSSMQLNKGEKTAVQRNATPANKTDSFASLSAFAGIKTTQASNTSLEQQRLTREKEKQAAFDREKRHMNMHFNDEGFWEKHSRTNTPGPNDQSYF
jgi:hypothetical protein